MILTLNAGSSSLKFALFATPELRKVAGDTIERIAHADHASHLPEIFAAIGDATLTAVGHRVVHGGPRSPRRSASTMPSSPRRALIPLAPEHAPAEIALMEAVTRSARTCRRSRASTPPSMRIFPRDAPAADPRATPRAACAATASTASRTRTCATRWRASIPPRRAAVVFAHLGNGCSLAALRDGRCVDTTMAFTPAAGLVMGTRTGDLDPGLAAYLARVDGLDAAGFDALVNGQSGLLGLSETSADMRDLLAAEAADPRAAEALAVFCLSARKHVAAMAASLEGLDTLVFAGGIGEHVAPIRARICAGLAHLGVRLDDARNDAHAPVLSAGDSRVTVRIIATDEEHQIARETAALLGT